MNPNLPSNMFSVSLFSVIPVEFATCGAPGPLPFQIDSYSVHMLYMTCVSLAVQVNQSE